MELKERFLKYVAVDTQSSEESTTFPSTAKQFDLLNMLADEMRTLGLTDVTTDKYGYTMGTIPASEGCENAPVIGFIAHVDTSPDMSGKEVHPRIIEEYDGSDIVLNNALTMRVADFPELRSFVGHTLIHTDGTTLLGADDKAGVAEIMTAAEYLLAHPEIKHGKIRIGFTPDEEVGTGTLHFDIPKFGADFAYTIDGGAVGGLDYENFNAATAKVTVNGANIHPGSSKNKMKNSMHIAMEFDSMLPVRERPVNTEGYEGFSHLNTMEGNVEKTSMVYIIRDHDAAKFDSKKARFEKISAYLNEKYGEGTIELQLIDSYRNMKEFIEPHMHLIENAKAAFTECGVTPVIHPIRGGTDGAFLSYNGLPCPNLSTGGENAHGKYEFISVQSLEKMVDVLEVLVQKYSKPI